VAEDRGPAFARGLVGGDQRGGVDFEVAVGLKVDVPGPGGCPDLLPLPQQQAARLAWMLGPCGGKHGLGG
jgi:hypothetical protein